MRLMQRQPPTRKLRQEGGLPLQEQATTIWRSPPDAHASAASDFSPAEQSAVRSSIPAVAGNAFLITFFTSTPESASLTLLWSWRFRVHSSIGNHFHYTREVKQP